MDGLNISDGAIKNKDKRFGDLGKGKYNQMAKYMGARSAIDSMASTHLVSSAKLAIIAAQEHLMYKVFILTTSPEVISNTCIDLARNSKKTNHNTNENL